MRSRRKSHYAEVDTALFHPQAIPAINNCLIIMTLKFTYLVLVFLVKVVSCQLTGPQEFQIFSKGVQT